MNLPDRVRTERLARKWSVRTAATAGGISNTWWGKFEDGVQPLTPEIAAAVARAYEWPAEWATVSQSDEVDLLRQRVDELRKDLTDLTRVVAKLVGRASKPASPGRQATP